MVGTFAVYELTFRVEPFATGAVLTAVLSKVNVARVVDFLQDFTD